MLNEQELQAITSKVGQEASDKIKAAMSAYEDKARDFANEAAGKSISKDTFEAYQKTAKETLDEVKDIAAKQGTSINEILAKVNSGVANHKSIAQTLKEDEDKLKSLYQNGSGTKTYMIETGERGEFVMRPFDATTKATGPHATVAGVNGGTAASIFQSIDSSSLLRLGGDSAIFSQYRNSKWVFDLVNVINADYGTSLAMWYEEVAKVGGSTTVPEGATKPLSQYGYTLKTATYKKRATLIGFTEEFSLDFPRLQSDILGKGRVDVVNDINTAVLADIVTSATAYNTATQYKNGAALTQYNDYLAIDALAAQVDNATYGQNANAAVMSTFKSHRVNTQMDTQGRFLMPPAALSNLTMVGNPAMGTDDLIVGDFKQFNVILRGGLIVRVGYNGTDFAQNMFSVVIEQYYFDYISALRAVAIVKGSTFSAVKTAITT